MPLCPAAFLHRGKRLSPGLPQNPTLLFIREQQRRVTGNWIRHQSVTTEGFLSLHYMQVSFFALVLFPQDCVTIEPPDKVLLKPPSLSLAARLSSDKSLPQTGQRFQFSQVSVSGWKKKAIK